ncbi:hypothetical protein ACROYT_G000562 [Oculina patagonica]
MVAYSVDLLSKCAQFRDEGKFLDVRLKVSEDVFPAHRIVLAANSDYFYAMFTDGMKESNQEVIELKDGSISPEALKIAMDSIYTGDLHVNEENVFEVLAAADHLQVTSVVQQCCDFLKREFIQLQLDLHNYCLLCTVADRHGLKDLQEAAEHKMASKYKDVCESEEFLAHVGADQLFSLLSRDDLNAPSETFVFKSVMQWIKHKKEERMAVAAKVIGAVRLGLVDIRVVIEELDTAEMQREPQIHMQLHETSFYNNMPSSNPKFALERRQNHDQPARGATVLHSKLCVLYGNASVNRNGSYSMQNACLHFFDPAKNEWEVKATTCQPHFGSSLVVVNNRLYVAGGNISIDTSFTVPCGNPAPVEVYNEENNTWSVVKQTRIPPNNLGAVEIEGRVYFIVNKFPVDIGIRIPPGEVYPVPLGEWENLGNTAETAVLCYLPVKRGSLTTE